MKKFLLRTLPFVAVILVYIGIGEYLLYRIRENVPISTVVKKQAHSEQEFYYYRTLFDNVLTTYKYEMLIEKKPSIVILGQSVVFNFRDFFVHPFEKGFYNTALMVRNVSDFEYFAKLIKDGTVKKPDFMVVGIEQSLILNDSELDKKEYLKKLDKDPVFNYKEHLRSIQNVYLKDDVREVPDINYGYGKRGMEGNGYRKDGSFGFKWELGMFMKDSSHVEGPLKDELITKTKMFKLPIDVNNNKKERLVQVLNTYKSLGIEIVLYFPPLTDSFYTFANQDKDFVAFWQEYLKFEQELEAKGFDVIKFTTPSQIGLSDLYMNNSNHPGDLIVAHQFRDYCKSTRRTNKFVDKFDIGHLDSMLKFSNNPLSFIQDTLIFTEKNNSK